VLVCGIAETVIIKLDRQREFFAERGGENFSVSKREFPVALERGREEK